MSREQSKADHYIQLLEEARCDGKWDTVPELVRKIRKHAPARTCLTLTAEAEHAVFQSSRTSPATARPSTARPRTAGPPTDLSHYIPLLLDAIEKESGNTQEGFQAQVCLGWVHWQLDEPALTINRLPKDIGQSFTELSGSKTEASQWTKVCALKATYLKAKAEEKTTTASESLETYESTLPVLSSIPPKSEIGKELRHWMELYLTGFCLSSSSAIKLRKSPILDTETLSAFRAWSTFWDAQGVPKGGSLPEAGISRRKVWLEYYIALSDILNEDLPFPTTALAPVVVDHSTRLQQKNELTQVQSKYETLLLSEVQFPKANERGEEVDFFVELVMRNWRMICGTWRKQELGEGGAESLSRTVLEILYRAAAKTFHSTSLLRHLFIVHVAVAEFDMALKAFETYMELIQKGKARVEKTGEAEQNLDDDETVILTASECITMLCRYGTHDAVEEAQKLSRFFEKWLNENHPIEQRTHHGESRQSGTNGMGGTIAPKSFAIIWRCIGIGYAQWARTSFDETSRSEYQSHAIKCLRNSLLPEYQSAHVIETLFSLGKVLAEHRELGPAIDVVRSGLLPPESGSKNSVGPFFGPFARERALIPLWHLMALLLSARQEFTKAARSCEGAFEQFRSPKNFFGDMDLSNTFKSDHLNEKVTHKNTGVVDEMDDWEKENVLEVKMTQLALIELLEGPDVAVNASDELLSLYSRLFGDPRKEHATPVLPSTTLAVPPQSSAGTVRSIRGSIFGRSGRSGKNTNSSTSEKNNVLTRSRTVSSVAPSKAPAIHVTHENGTPTKQSVGSEPKDQQEKSPGGRSNASGNTEKNPSVSDASKEHRGLQIRAPTVIDGEQFMTPPTSNDNRDQWIDAQTADLTSSSSASTSSSESGVVVSHPSHPERSKTSDNARPGFQNILFSNPTPQFPKDQAVRRHMSILVKVWMMIAGFYRRAAMYEDAKGAVEEAEELVGLIETNISKESTSTSSLLEAGWGGVSSVAELWADIYSERGNLAVAEAHPYTAMNNFESALTHFRDHAAGIIGLSNILLDVYTEELLPPPNIPPLELEPTDDITSRSSPMESTHTISSPIGQSAHTLRPIGLPPMKSPTRTIRSTSKEPKSHLPGDRSDSSPTALLDRLAARDRAYGLLNGLTKLGSGWNQSEAWFALARVHELSGQIDKAKEVLWWCVDLEDVRPVRDWKAVGAGGYVL